MIMLKGWLKTAFMYAVCHDWISEEMTMRLWNVLGLKNV